MAVPKGWGWKGRRNRTWRIDVDRITVRWEDELLGRIGEMVDAFCQGKSIDWSIGAGPREE